MTIIATEISYVEPFEIDALFSQTGERFDFVINANQKEGDYWMRVQTQSPCRTVVEGFALLRYGKEGGDEVTFANSDPPRLSENFTKEKLFNSPKPKVKDVPFLRLNSFDYDESIIKGEPDYKFFLFLDSPTLTDDALYKNGINYKWSCKTNFFE